MKQFVAIFLTASVCWPTLAQDAIVPTEPARWTPELAMQFHSIDNPVFSPNGQWLAFTVREPIMEADKSEYLTHVHLVRSDGTGARQFTRGEKSSGSPQFSPDGSHLTFVREAGDKSQLWIIPIDGGEARQLTDSTNGVGSYRWSPDGSRIAFIMQEPDSDEEEKAKKEKSWVEREDQHFKYNHLHVLQVDDFESAESKQVTAGDFTVTDFDWSPDNTRLVFSHARNTNINELFLGQDISWVSSDSGAVVSLIARPGVDANPQFSHDGSRVAFQTQSGQREPVGLADISIMDADGGNEVALAKTYDRSPSLVGWSADDSRLVVAESYHTTSQIYALSTSRPDRHPERWSKHDGVIRDVTLSTAGDVVAFTMESPDTPPDLFVSRLSAWAPAQVSDLHQEIAMPPAGRTELISWKSVDGLDVEGLLTYPVGYEFGSQVPLVLQIHGGPAGVFSQSFTGGPSIYLTQVFAQRGYAVLRPNPRGSSGYGKEFRYANVMDWGYGDWDDVESGVDAVIAMGVAHPDSLLLMGWSYGGYMTSFGVTRTNRFKAASMGAGLPNLISMVTTTDIPDYLAAHMGGEYFDDYETYQKHSAIYRIKNVTTPTQVIHGANDVRVPTDQGREFYVSLKRLGVPTEMIILPRTPHGPREPRLLMGVTPAILEWFEQHMERKPVGATPGS